MNKKQIEGMDQARRAQRNKIDPDFPLPRRTCGVAGHIAWMKALKERTHGRAMTYHPNAELNASIALDIMDAEIADIKAGYSPRRWTCDCGASHARGHFPSLGQHRCLACGYVGSGGTMHLPDGEHS